MTTVETLGESMQQMINKLVALSRADEYDVFNDIVWPEKIDDDQFWMSPHLLSVYNTPVYDLLEEKQLFHLSKEECINFFSLNVHGIRNLLLDVISYIHSPGFETVSEYLHHFIDEENEHMYYFSKFCNKYGGKVYKDKRMSFPGSEDSNAQLYLVFMRICVFEEIVDYYNTRMANDKTLHPFIQEVNRLHHKDESRHIAFGNTFLALLFHELKERLTAPEIETIREYTRGYIKSCIELLYNPYIYKEVGIPDPFGTRVMLLEHDGRKEAHAKILNRVLNKFADSDILPNKENF